MNTFRNTPFTTPPRSLVRVGDVTTSLTLTPASSTGPKQGSRRRDRGRPRKLFCPEPEVTARSDADVTVASRQPWSPDEVRALVAFILLYSEGSSWPSRGSKGDSFWKRAGQHVQKAVNSMYCRSG